jgi:hypothetical protein
MAADEAIAVHFGQRCKMSTLRGFLSFMSEDWQSVMLCSPERNVVPDTVARQ